MFPSLLDMFHRERYFAIFCEICDGAWKDSTGRKNKNSCPNKIDWKIRDIIWQSKNVKDAKININLNVQCVSRPCCELLILILKIIYISYKYTYKQTLWQREKIILQNGWQCKRWTQKDGFMIRYPSTCAGSPVVFIYPLSKPLHSSAFSTLWLLGALHWHTDKIFQCS